MENYIINPITGASLGRLYFENYLKEGASELFEEIEELAEDTSKLDTFQFLGSLTNVLVPHFYHDQEYDAYEYIGDMERLSRVFIPENAPEAETKEISITAFQDATMKFFLVESPWNWYAGVDALQRLEQITECNRDWFVFAITAIIHNWCYCHDLCTEFVFNYLKYEYLIIESILFDFEHKKTD